MSTWPWQWEKRVREDVKASAPVELPTAEQEAAEGHFLAARIAALPGGREALAKAREETVAEYLDRTRAVPEGDSPPTVPLPGREPLPDGVLGDGVLVRQKVRATCDRDAVGYLSSADLMRHADAEHVARCWPDRLGTAVVVEIREAP